MLKLDGPTQWSWFLVLSPMWVLDFLLLVFSLVQVCLATIPYLESYASGNATLGKIRSLWFFIIVICKTTFQTLLCLSLDSIVTMPLILIMSPLWVILIGICFDLGLSCFETVKPSVQEYLDKRCENTNSNSSNQAQSRSMQMQPRNSGNSSTSTASAGGNRRTEFTSERGSESLGPGSSNARGRVLRLRASADGRSEEFLSA